MKVSTAVDVTMNELRRSFLSLSGTIGLIAAALPPALMFTFAVIHALTPMIGAVEATAVGVALGIALEATGVKISHVALDFFEQWRNGDKEALTTFVVSVLLTVAYLAAGVVAISNFDSDPTVRLAGFLSYGVAGVMYVASGLEMLLHNRQDGMVAKLRAAEDEWQAKAEAAQRLAENRQALANEWQTKAEVAQSSAEQAQASADEWQDRARAAQASADKARGRGDELQKQLERWQTAVLCWQHINERYKSVAMVNAGLIEKDKAVELTGLSAAQSKRIWLA